MLLGVQGLITSNYSCREKYRSKKLRLRWLGLCRAFPWVRDRNRSWSLHHVSQGARAVLPRERLGVVVGRQFLCAFWLGRPCRLTGREPPPVPSPFPTRSCGSVWLTARPAAVPDGS